MPRAQKSKVLSYRTCTHLPGEKNKKINLPFVKSNIIAACKNVVFLSIQQNETKVLMPLNNCFTVVLKTWDLVQRNV